jgi:hypothetical protein
MVVARQKGAAGEFHNVTWPGVCGVFNAVAPGRFACALNQAPMRRHRTGIVLDWARNRVRAYRSRALPPAHLLRHVFETAASYEDAKHMLSTYPLCLPVIYILTGTKEGEGCVIERLEEQYALRELGEREGVCAANHFESYLNGIGHGWMPRAMASHQRSRHGEKSKFDYADESFGWFSAPIANPLSRLAMTADAAKGVLTLIGTEGAQAVTQRFVL